jgi:hypothetical protein
MKIKDGQKGAPLLADFARSGDFSLPRNRTLILTNDVMKAVVLSDACRPQSGRQRSRRIPATATEAGDSTPLSIAPIGPKLQTSQAVLTDE